MEITNEFEGPCQFYLRRQAYFEHCFIHVRTDIEVLIKRYEYLKYMLKSSCSEEGLRKCMKSNGFLKSLIENSTQDNQTLVEKIAELNEVITQTRKCNGRLLEEANEHRKINDYEELTRKLVECQEENKMFMSQVAALEQEKAQWNGEVSFWRQKGDELRHRYDKQASEIADIVKDASVVKQEIARVIELVKDDPATEKQAEGPCQEIKGVFSMGMAVISQLESSVNEQIGDFQHDIYQIAQANSSLETKCWSLEQELKIVSEEKASLAERLASQRNGLEDKLKLEKLKHEQTLNRLHAAQVLAANLEVELPSLRERCECSERQLAAAEASRLTHKKSLDDALAKQVESEAKLENAEVQVKQLEEELQEERRRLSEQITAIEERNGLEEELHMETLAHGKTLNRFHGAQVHAANLEVELSTLRERCECSERHLAAAEASRLTHKKSLDDALAKQVESEAKLENAEAQVKQLEEELQEERRRLSEQTACVEERNKLLDKARQENVTMQQENARQVEIFQEEVNTLQCNVKSMLLKLHATEEKLTVGLCQEEIGQMVHALEKRKAVRHLEEEIESLELERSQHLDTITTLENKIKELNNSFDMELVSKEEHMEYLQREVEELEKYRKQLISINSDVAGEIEECQARIKSVCLMADKVKDSMTEQTLEKENMITQDAVTSTTPRPQVLSPSNKFQNCVSLLSEIRERVSEMTENEQQVNHVTGRSQTAGTSAVITIAEQSRQNSFYTGDDSVVTSATGMVEDIKAQLRAYLQEETKKRNREQVAVSRAQEAESELEGKCKELNEARLELKVVKNKYNSVKRELHELKQQNRRLLKDLSTAEGTMIRTDHEITTLQHDVEKGLRTIRKQCETIIELRNDIKDLRKMSHERKATAKCEPESSRRIQEKACTQVNMEIPPPEVTNKEQSSAEIAQGTADNLPSGSNSLDDGAHRYEQIRSELEARIKIMESSHLKEVENLERVHKENMISLKMASEIERAKDRKTYEELVGKQQEMHDEQISELNHLHESELSLFWGNMERGRISKETQTPEDSTETSATVAQVSPTLDSGSTDPVTAEERTLLVEENSFDVRVKVLEQQHVKELDSLKMEHARKIAEIAEELENSLAEEEANLEKQLQALRDGNEQQLLWLKTRYCSDTKHEKIKFNVFRTEVFESVKKAFSASKMEVIDIKPSPGSRMEVALSDTSAIVLDEFHSQILRCLVHSGLEVLAVEQLAALHNLVCPVSCSALVKSFRSESIPQSFPGSQSDFSNEQSYLRDNFSLRSSNTESEIHSSLSKVMDLKLMNEKLGEADTNSLSQMARLRQTYSSTVFSFAPIYDGQYPGILKSESSS